MAVSSSDTLTVQLRDLRNRVHRLEDVVLLLCEHASRGEGSSGKPLWLFVDEIRAERAQSGS